jgi:hypothetical protein
MLDTDALPPQIVPAEQCLLIQVDGVLLRYRATGWHAVKLAEAVGCVPGTPVSPARGERPPIQPTARRTRHGWSRPRTPPRASRPRRLPTAC